MGSIAACEDKPRNKCRKWRLFVNLGKDENGHRLQRSKRVTGTYTEAKEALLVFEHELLGVTEKDVEFKTFADNFLERRKPLLASSTYETKRAMNKTLKKVFGDVKMSQLTGPMIEQKMNALLTEGVKGKPCKPSYVATLYTHLSSIVADAVRLGVIGRSPLIGVKRPGGKPDEKDAPTAEQVKSLIDALDPSNRHECSVFLCAAMGIRRGESLAVRWCDYDEKAGVLRIRQSLRPDGSFGAPKTDAGRRDLPVPDYIAEALLLRKACLKRQLRRSVNAELLPEVPSLDELTICSDELGKPTTTSSQTNWWIHHRSKFGLAGYPLHSLRHAYLTMLAQAGTNPRVMMSLAGHASAKISLEVYSHAQNEDKKKAVEDISRMIASETHPE